MQTGQAGPESTDRVPTDDARMWDSPGRRFFTGERKTVVLRLLPLLPLGAAGCSGSL
ncbi:hypothetical protein D4764_15G0000250 [Takifugu flavidus]|uniref:Uncharacterized protein n=1 Tax=Takifugu flavidus TaxID=433684 RepID=A0A5C6P1K3_9TELE|nr:hypothetical protein D4764_15G0000250 [Takifugu flavidus]